jgi:hypothetical protein
VPTNFISRCLEATSLLRLWPCPTSDARPPPNHGSFYAYKNCGSESYEIPSPPYYPCPPTIPSSQARPHVTPAIIQSAMPRVMTVRPSMHTAVSPRTPIRPLTRSSTTELNPFCSQTSNRVCHVGTLARPTATSPQSLAPPTPHRTTAPPPLPSPPLARLVPPLPPRSPPGRSRAITSLARPTASSSSARTLRSGARSPRTSLARTLARPPVSRGTSYLTRSGPSGTTRPRRLRGPTQIGTRTTNTSPSATAIRRSLCLPRTHPRRLQPRLVRLVVLSPSLWFRHRLNRPLLSPSARSLPSLSIRNFRFSRTLRFSACPSRSCPSQSSLPRAARLSQSTVSTSTRPCSTPVVTRRRSSTIIPSTRLLSLRCADILSRLLVNQLIVSLQPSYQDEYSLQYNTTCQSVTVNQSTAWDFSVSFGKHFAATTSTSTIYNTFPTPTSVLVGQDPVLYSAAADDYAILGQFDFGCFGDAVANHAAGFGGYSFAA